MSGTARARTASRPTRALMHAGGRPAQLCSSRPRHERAPRRRSWGQDKIGKLHSVLCKWLRNLLNQSWHARAPGPRIGPGAGAHTDSIDSLPDDRGDCNRPRSVDREPHPFRASHPERLLLSSRAVTDPSLTDPSSQKKVEDVLHRDRAPLEGHRRPALLRQPEHHCAVDRVIQSLDELAVTRVRHGCQCALDD